MTHTENVHVAFGAALAAAGAAALWSRRSSAGWARYLSPALLFGIGLLMFIPVESGTRTYVQYGFWATLRDAVPDGGESWLAPLGQLHVLQHKIAGLLAMAVGLIEMGRVSGRLMAPAWGWVFPPALVGAALVLGIHGGTHVHLAHHIERVHHWILGACLATGGLTLALAQGGLLRAPAWRSAWAALVLVAGLDIALFYRIP
jgi:hypothetical protein